MTRENATLPETGVGQQALDEFEDDDDQEDGAEDVDADLDDDQGGV